MIEIGKEINIEDLSEEQAITIFGLPLYTAWKKSCANKSVSTVYIVTKADENTMTLTYKFHK